MRVPPRPEERQAGKRVADRATSDQSEQRNPPGDPDGHRTDLPEVLSVSVRVPTPKVDEDSRRRSSRRRHRDTAPQSGSLFGRMLEPTRRQVPTAFIAPVTPRES